MSFPVTVIALIVLPSIVGTAKVKDYLREVPQNVSYKIAFPIVSKYYSIHISCILHYTILFYDFHSVHVEFFKDISLDTSFGGLSLGIFISSFKGLK